MNDSMIGANNRGPRGTHSAFAPTASADWKTPADEALDRAKAHKSIHGFASLQAAAADLLDKATTIAPDVRRELARLRESRASQVLKEIVDREMAKNGGDFTAAYTHIRSTELELVNAYGKERPGQPHRGGALMDDDVPAGPMPAGTKRARGKSADARDRARIIAALRAELDEIEAQDEDNDDNENETDPRLEAKERMSTSKKTLAELCSEDPRLNERLARYYDPFNLGRVRRQRENVQLTEDGGQESARAALTRLSQERAARDCIDFSEALRKVVLDQPMLYERASREYIGG